MSYGLSYFPVLYKMRRIREQSIKSRLVAGPRNVHSISLNMEHTRHRHCVRRTGVRVPRYGHERV